MKLEFLTEQSTCLGQVLREMKMAEETAEVILPDSCPDAVQVLFSGGMAFLRGKEITEGRLTVSAGVSAMALVQPQEDAPPEVAEAYIPMSIRLEDARIQPGMEAEITVCLRRLDGHLVNPRKVMLRAAVSAEITLWQRRQEGHITGCTQKNVCMQRKVLPIRCLSVMGEKNYTVEDTVQLSPSGTIRTLAGVQAELRHTDARLTGTRAVLKGEAELQILYLSSDGIFTTGTATLPFSQYIDLGDCGEEDELQLTSCLTGADVEPTLDGGGLNVTLQLLSMAKVWARREMGYMADAYSLEGTLTPETEERSYRSLLDRQFFSPVGRGTVSGDIQRVIYCNCLPGEGTYSREGENVTFSIPVTAHVLWEDGQGMLHGGSAEAKLESGSRAAEECGFEIHAQTLHVTPSTGSGGAELRISGTLEADSFGDSRISEVLGADWEEAAEQRDGPGLVIRRIRPGETLWDAAKAAKTTEQAIMEANGLAEDQQPQGMLLIPRGR